ncbi:hypothetical protein HK096_002708 [Nowakowskiella sp. JEL0078]|nr:hypothetical protein HK096_002708 [Nowakowskiella sp. JEL0078]
MSEQRDVRWGILGSGYIAAKVLTQGIKRSGRAVAVGSRNLARAQEFAAAHGIEKSYGSYQEVLDDENVDAIYLALPTQIREEWTIKAAKAKKHVLSFKPLATTLDTVKKMIEACEENNVVFMDGTWWQHLPRTIEIADFLKDPNCEIGKVRSVVSTFTFSDPNMSADNIRAQPAAEPLGCLGDIGWYTIRFSLFAYDYELPEKAVGVITGRHPETNAITQFSGVLLFANNRSATFDCSFNAALNQRSEICGEHGLIRIPDSFVPFGGRKEDNMDSKTRFYYAKDGDAEGQWREKIQDIEISVQEYMINDFHDCIFGRKDWRVYASQTKKIHSVLDACMESAANGKDLAFDTVWESG